MCFALYLYNGSVAINSLTYNVFNIPLKVEYAFFQKRFRKLIRRRVSKQICSQSAVRGVPTRDVEERERSQCI